MLHAGTGRRWETGALDGGVSPPWCTGTRTPPGIALTMSKSGGSPGAHLPSPPFGGEGRVRGSLRVTGFRFRVEALGVVRTIESLLAEAPPHPALSPEKGARGKSTMSKEREKVWACVIGFRLRSGAEPPGYFPSLSEEKGCGRRCLTHSPIFNDRHLRRSASVSHAVACPVPVLARLGPT
jgi:hypothetical protein